MQPSRKSRDKRDSNHYSFLISFCLSYNCSINCSTFQKSGTQVIGSEDCLYLNIYRPDTGAEQLPVLFFIHGGNNQTDGGEMMDGDTMAAALDAVVVTINLRLNSLGWLNLPALKTGDPYEDSGNFGLLDILCALDWFR
ncbi:MAG: carboxylesterase family protein, partial [Oscillospiraceae bacterium]